MTKTNLIIAFFCMAAILTGGCKKKFNPELPKEVTTNDYAGSLTGYDSMDLRTIFAISDDTTSLQKKIILDTNFLFIPNVHVLTPSVMVTMNENGSFVQNVSISLIDTTGNQIDDIPVELSGTYSKEAVQINIRLTVNETPYHLIFNGIKDDYSSLVQGLYYGTYALGVNESPDDSIFVKWKNKNVVSLVANTKIEDTPIVTDEDVVVKKEDGFCTVNATTKMDIQLLGTVVPDVPTEIYGRITSNHFHLEVTFTLSFFPAGLTMTFIGKR